MTIVLSAKQRRVAEVDRPALRLITARLYPVIVRDDSEAKRNREVSKN